MALGSGHRPFRLRLYCNQGRRLKESYRRDPEASVIAEFELVGKKSRTALGSSQSREVADD